MPKFFFFVIYLADLTLEGVGRCKKLYQISSLQRLPQPPTGDNHKAAAERRYGSQAASGPSPLHLYFF
jgi:hypothetical protein